ncbi:hypothetical protein [Gilvimarinus algae]|uniref:Glycosyltransferase 2-like domain-containing protein n=1 Tax=Gilvimarinus algae TaxID=3058037 RepID=A0ABT8TLM3_9GAMM|nr:hypothetical protein [Gilvimarinus sp. SDUM040014]MDO3383262.1 hypothetical protein [Gilvimarinus sp. SDUM040014]
MAVQDSQTGTAVQYIALPFFSWPLHEAERLVLTENDVSPTPLHETLAQVLTLCDQWRSLEEHTAVAIEKMPVLQPHTQQLLQGLKHMVERGLLVDAAKLSQVYAKPDSSEPAPEPIKTLYVRTYRCPNALERLLSSLQNGRAGASVNTLVVVDDAREASDLDLSRTLLSKWRPQLSATVIHITRADRERLADTLAAASGADAQDLRWWLNGDPNDPEMTAGATFNTALLLSAGTATAIMDDDAQLTPYGDPQEASQMGVAGSEVAHWSMYASTEALQSAWSPLDIDPLAAHSRWLGQSLSTLSAQTENPCDFWQSVTSADLHNLKPGATVKVSANGLLGDPGTGQASWLYTLPPEQLSPWLQSEDTYRQLVSRRLLARRPQGHKLIPRHALLTPLVGVDNRTLMPPTIPNGRGEDAVFVELLCCVYPDSLFAQLPWMLKHEPERERQFDRDKLLQPANVDSGRFMTLYLRRLRHTVPSAEPQTRLQWLGQSLKTLAQAPEATLASEYRRHLSDDRSSMARELIRNLQTLQPPPYLAEDMQLLLTRSTRDIGADQQALTATLAQLRQRAERYSQALASWHTAWDHCRQLGEAQSLAMAGTE